MLFEQVAIALPLAGGVEHRLIHADELLARAVEQRRSDVVRLDDPPRLGVGDHHRVRRGVDERAVEPFGFGERALGTVALDGIGDAVGEQFVPFAARPLPR